MQQQTTRSSTTEGAVLFAVVIFGTAGIVGGLQAYGSYLANQQLAQNSNDPSLYLQGGNWFLQGATNHTQVTIPANCNPV